MMSSATLSDVETLENIPRGAPIGGSGIVSGTASEGSSRGAERSTVANVSEDGERGRREEEEDRKPLIMDQSVIMDEEPYISPAKAKKISWKCGLCGYYVLAMDHNGNPLELTNSPSGEPLPMSCPRCMLLHHDWEPAVPFDDFNNHANIRSKQSNSYVISDQKSGKQAGFVPARTPAERDLKKTSADITRILQEVEDRWRNYAPRESPTSREQGPKGRLMAYYCDKCNRELLRMDQYGELVPMVSDKEGKPLPIVCPGCKEEHSEWVVRPFTVTR
ncbi:uncharacterized protein TEOVI_000717700 [Trypanosoma equiperdum]|uniref:Uncharacterized protein n=4 Tax=Trypanozoon TaxID=39700 RepID=Q382J2_TRYB2|nr:hypothetical protein, conserved [Trypanosoma brucei gambiense DAL972]XP_829401.1 hypothetical protein, conserved [Trypanosoma brucei brucei TREU927]RHW68458.1 hypothetical protein DPX39_110112400 [Trypanosoma brucei equiperdum]SCU66290.1 hypothetical protein, conserved [Trypanosoma equiperdum]EAN80289.1 hypothetical protein, conserved [Trypanosoma brucei brucei TREU927]CBH18382.1 hypothetical protein, conserved [Trypanosoma brucei gambiense DAL972]|eukprot:XP_011780646.1 hypothetical protein, conserved [Trypanosoma brucei gambiense DAL972]